MNRIRIDSIFSELVRWLGLAGVIHEAMFEHSQRPYLIVLFGSMMGLSRLNWQGVGVQKITGIAEIVRRIPGSSRILPPPQ